MKNSKKLTPLFVFLVVGCMKDPELKPDFGPEVTNQDYANAISQVELPDPYTIKKGEFAYFTQETYLEGRPFNLDKRWAYTVTNKEDDVANNQWVFTYSRETREYAGGQEKISIDESTARLEKQAPLVDSTNLSPLSQLTINTFDNLVSINSQDAKNSFAISEVSPLTSLSKIQASANEKKISFHNLRVQKGFFPTPEFVQQRANCGGKDPAKCKDPLKVHLLSYDMVDWEQNQKFKVEWVISPEAPYFGSTRLNLAAPNESFPGVLRSCATTDIPIQGQRVRVTQCDELKDFTFGQD